MFIGLLSQKSLHFLLHHSFELIHTIRQQTDGRVSFGRLEGSDPRLEVVGFHAQVQTRHHGHHRQEGGQGCAQGHGAGTRLPGWAPVL